LAKRRLYSVYLFIVFFATRLSERVLIHFADDMSFNMSRSILGFLGVTPASIEDYRGGREWGGADGHGEDEEEEAQGHMI
jgi:hypothetical protein